MGNNHSMSRVERSRREKVTRYSVRKVSFGAASVAVAAFFMFLGNGAVYAAEPNVTATGSALAATPANNQLDENSGASDSTVSKAQADTTTSKPADVTPAPVVSSTTSTTEEKSAEKNTEASSAEANSVENKQQTTVKAEEPSTTSSATKPAEVTATTESNKPKSRKKRAVDASPTAAADTDPDANRVYTAPRANARLDELKEKLQELPSAIQNNTKVNNMDGLGAATGVEAGKVKEITEFGGWKAVNQADGSAGKFVVARATDKGVFPIETMNTVGGSRTAYIGEQSFNRDSKYMLFLSEVRTEATKDKESYESQPYSSAQADSRGGVVAIGVKGYKGIEKTFTVYDSKSPAKVTLDFKTGFSGIAELGSDVTVANYKVEVFSISNSGETKVYTTEFDPKKPSDDNQKTVVAAKVSTRAQSTNVAGTTEANKAAALEELAKDRYKPYATGGRFTSKEIVLPEGTTAYKVRISAANDRYLGMDYHSRFAQYALPVTGVDFSISQNTNIIAKDLLTKIYTKLQETVVKDEKGMTAESKAAYDAELEMVRNLVEDSNLTTTDAYKVALTTVLQKKDELKVDKSALTKARTEVENLITTVSTEGKIQSSIDEYNKVKAEAQTTIDEAKKIIDSAASTVDEVALAVAEVKQKKAELKVAEAGLVDKMTDAQKAELEKVDEALATANLDGKTPKSVEAYNAAVAKLQSDIDATKAKAQEVVGKGDNATKAEATETQVKLAELKAQLAEAKALLKDKSNKDELTTAKEELNTLAKAEDPTVGKTEESKAKYDDAKTAAEASVTEAEKVINNEDATAEQVAAALADVKIKKAALETAKAGLVDQITQDQKDELANADEDLKLADTTGKTNASIKAYNDEVGKLSAELEAAKQAAKDLLAKGDNAGELEAYRLQAKISKLKSKLATVAKLLKDIDKSAVKKEVEEAAKNATDAIESNVDLPADKKAEAKAKIADEANTAIAAIDDATTEDDVTAAKNAGKLAIAKEAAKADLEAAQAIKEKVIAGNEKLSDDEKQAVKEQVQNVVDEAKKAVDTATEQAAVDSAKTTGKEAIDALNPVGKEKALDEIQKVTEAKLEAIDKNEKLSEKEKIKAKAKVAKAAIAVVEAINEATDQATVDSKVTEGTKAISSVAEVGKDRAKSAIDIALSAKETAIDANDKLSEAEKSTAKSAAKKAAEDAKKAIESVTTQAEVDANVTKGTKAISSVAEVGKDRAKSALDIALSAKETAIDNNDKLSEAEKSAAKAAAKKAADEAKKAIDAATTQAEVDAKVTEGRQSISSVVEVGKDQAKSALDTALSAKETAIDSNAKLSDAEKSAAKSAAKKAADEAKKAIDAATDQAGVDRILRNDIYKDDAAINEVEAFDLSSLLVNGFVSVKQGETLTDQEVLSKVNLPKDVEVIKVEKPTTSALGRLVAKVTLKLSDGSVEEINVPVEVVAPQNHGNEGNGANNGANNTEAKVNKAKLEAAIHQLDEFKFDADTAKEANALSADAKKVFANADTTQAAVDAMVKRIQDFMAKVAPSTDHATPANNQSAQTTVVAPATTQAAANASQTLSAQANARKAAKELPNTGTADSTVAMVAAAASALLGLGLAGRRRKEDEEA